MQDGLTSGRTSKIQSMGEKGLKSSLGFDAVMVSFHTSGDWHTNNLWEKGELMEVELNYIDNITMPSREFGEDDRRSSKANRFGETNVWVVWRG